LYNTLIPPSHESPALGLRISRLSGSVELTLRYTTPDIHCRHRRHECDGGITRVASNVLAALHGTVVANSCAPRGNLFIIMYWKINTENLTKNKHEETVKH